MNSAIGAYVGVSKQTEMLLMTVLALWVNIFDMAIFEFSSNLDQVWNVEIDNEIFNPNAVYVIRMLLSGVVLIRTFTLHLYIAFLIAVFWPVCFGTRPTLMLPWLVVSAIKNLGTGIISIATGGYTCMIYGPLRPACLRFLLSQLIDLSPSFYMWFVGLSLYCDLKKPKSVNRLQIKAMDDQEMNVALRRRKVKSMIDEDILRQQFESRSFQKKFLSTSAVEVNEFVSHCSYDNLKNKFSRSLDSLLDVLNVQTELLDIEDSEPLDIDSSTTLQQKTAKLLGISMDEIECIKQNQQTRSDFPVYPVQPQKKIQTISLLNSRYESPAKLLPETSLYSPPNVKPIRVTKSELKSAKEFSKFETEFIQSAPEKEIRVHDLTQNGSFESLSKMQMMYKSSNSMFNIDDVTDDNVNVDLTNLSPTKTCATKEHRGECSNRNRAGYSRKPDRDKPEENAQVENPHKYKFSNTMSDKSHFLLDEHCFLFDKNSMMSEPKVESAYANRKRSVDNHQNKNSEEKQKCLDAPKTNVVNTKTTYNVMNKQKSLDERFKNRNSKPTFKKTQVINKKIDITGKILPNNTSNVTVLHRNSMCKNEYFNKNKVAIKTRIAKLNKTYACEENKLYTIEENKDVASVSSKQEAKHHDLGVNKVTAENKSVLNQEENKKEIISNEDASNNGEENKNKKCLSENEELNLAGESKVSEEVERKNQKGCEVTSKNVANNNESTANKTCIRSKCSMGLRIPVPFLSIKHSLKKMTPAQKEAIHQEEKLLPKIQNKPLVNISQALSEKISQIIQEKKKQQKTTNNSNSVEEINKTEVMKIGNNNEFEFTAKIDEQRGTLPVKSSSINKILDFHFKERNNKTKDNKMEDLFKKKSVPERKDSKTSDKDKLGFPAYFSNKINRMITDACQIRKKSCKKINLFIKVPANSSFKHRSKISTIELFRKQSPPKANLFDITRTFSIGKLEVPPCKEDNKDCLTNLNITKPDSIRTEIYLSKKNVHSTDKLPDKTTNDTNVAETSSKENNNLSQDIRDNTLLKSLVMSSKSNESRCMEKLSSLNEINKAIFKVEETETIPEKSDAIKAHYSLSLAEAEILNDINLSVCSNTAVQETNFPIISENEKCKKLSEQAADKIMTMAKTYLTNVSSSNNSFLTDVNKSSCKRLLEQVINKIISLTKTRYSKIFNEEPIDCKLNVIAPETSSCKKLSDYAIDKLLASTSLTYTPNINDFNETLNATQLDKSNNLHFNEVNRKPSIPVIKEEITMSKNSSETIPSMAKIEDNNELINMEKSWSNSTIDLKLNKSHIIALVEDAVSRKSLDEMNIPLDVFFKNDSTHIISTSNVLLDNGNSNLVENTLAPDENRNIPTPLDSSTQIESYKIASSFNEMMLTTKAQQVEKNCNWISQDCINIVSSSNANTLINGEMSTTEETQNLPKIKDEIVYEEIVQNVDQNTVSTKSELPKPSPRATKKEIEIFMTAKNNCFIEINSNEAMSIDVIKSNRLSHEKMCRWTPQSSIELIPSSNSEPAEANTSIPETNTVSNEEDKGDKKSSQKNKNEPEANIPLIKVEKECQGTAQHHVKLISTTDKICEKSLNTIEELIKERLNVVKMKLEHEGSLQNSNKRLSSLSYETAFDESSPAFKKTKICKGTSHHDIKLISSLVHESSSETNIFQNVKTPCLIKDDLYVPLKEQKVCKGSSQNYVKVSSLSSEEFSSDTIFSQRDTLLKILKEYQSVPIMKEEKVCKGTSKHKIKLVSSYKKDSPNKINLFHTETKGKKSTNENITIIKKEKICKGALQHSIKLVSSSKNDSQNKTIFIVQEQSPKRNEAIFVNKKNCKGNVSSTINKSSHQTDVFGIMNSANGKQNLTVIQKQNNDKESSQSEAKDKINLFKKDEFTSTDDISMDKTEENHLDNENQLETFQKLNSNTIQDILKNDTEKLTDKTVTDFISTNRKNNSRSLIVIKSSTNLSSLKNKEESSRKSQGPNREESFDEKSDDIDRSRCSKYISNQIDFSCQTSTLSKRILESNPNEITKKLSTTKSNLKSTSSKSYQDLNLQKLAFTLTSNSKFETKSINENLSKDEKKDSSIVLNPRSSRNVSYVSIHKERLEKAKNLDSDLNKSVLLQNCTFLEDGYTRLYNLLGVKQENFDMKAHKKFESSFNF